MKDVFSNPNLFVITGGPGAGKTTLLRELRKRGIGCVDEGAREIIGQQVKTNGDAVPWGNKTRYTELMLERSIADFLQHASTATMVFFDRGIPDVLCYARLVGLRDEEVKTACDRYRYNKRVFIAPPWEEIYSTDEERKQTLAEAVKTYEVMTSAYGECGYQLIELPCVDAVERAEFVLRQVERPE